MGYPSAHLHPYPFWWETHTHTYGYGFVRARAWATLILPMGYLCSSLRENQQSNAAEKKSPFLDSFQTADINIEVPSGVKDIPLGTFTVPGLLYQNLTAVIQAVFSSPLASYFHFSPFKLFHKSLSGEDKHVFSELYNSDVFIKEHDNVQCTPLPPDQLERRL